MDRFFQISGLLLSLFILARPAWGNDDVVKRSFDSCHASCIQIHQAPLGAPVIPDSVIAHYCNDFCHCLTDGTPSYLDFTPRKTAYGYIPDTNTDLVNSEKYGTCVSTQSGAFNTYFHDHPTVFPAMIDYARRTKPQHP